MTLDETHDYFRGDRFRYKVSDCGDLISVFKITRVLLELSLGELTNWGGSNDSQHGFVTFHMRKGFGNSS